MGAPLLIDRKEEINTIDLAKKEYEAGVLPMSIKRIMPEKREVL